MASATEVGPELQCPHCGEQHPEHVLICPRHEKYLPLSGRLLDTKFRLIRQLGAGGMSTVWMAENVLVRKFVAIKVLHPEFAHNPRTLERFRNEATSAGRIGSKNICDILDLGQSQLGPYIVMEMLKGSNLGEYVEAQGPLEPGLAVLIVREALEGLSAAHRARIIHRDLKPENVFLHEPTPGQLVVKIMDFGISKFTEGAVGSGKTGAGVLMGTPEYMSPEQAESAAAVDVRTDVWAMGAILYFALTGVEAFRGDRLAAVLMAVINQPHTPATELRPELDPDLSAIVDRCLDKDPAGRLQSSDALSAALSRFESTIDPRGAATILGISSVAALVQGDTSVRPTGPTQPVPILPQNSGAGIGRTHSEGPSQVAASMSAATNAASGAERDGTWSSELGGATQSGVGDAPKSWSSGAAVADRRPESLSGGGGLWMTLLVLLIIGGGVGAYLYLHAKNTAGDDDAVAVADGAEAGDLSSAGTPPDLRATTGETGALGTGETGTGETGGSAGSGETGESGSAPTTGAGTTTSGSSTTGSSTGGSSTGGSSTGGSSTGGSSTGGSSTGGSSTGGGDSGSDTGGSDTGDAPRPRPDMSKLFKVGSTYTHRAKGPAGSFAAAGSYCRGLNRKRHGRLTRWRMASAAQIKKFAGAGVTKTKYWAQSPSGPTATTVNLFGNQVKQEPTGSSARPFCVSSR